MGSRGRAPALRCPLQGAGMPAKQPRGADRTCIQRAHRRRPQAAGCRRAGSANRSRWCSCSWVLPRRSRGDTQPKARADSGFGEPSRPIDDSSCSAAAAAAAAGAVAAAPLPGLSARGALATSAISWRSPTSCCDSRGSRKPTMALSFRPARSSLPTACWMPGQAGDKSHAQRSSRHAHVMGVRHAVRRRARRRRPGRC